MGMLGGLGDFAQRMIGFQPFGTTPETSRDTYRSDVFKGGGAGAAGLPWLQKVLSDPYMANEAPLVGGMADVNRAYQTAANRQRGAALASGQRGGVAQAGQGNVEMARATGMADQVRKWKEYIQNLGDERLKSLLMPWMNLYEKSWESANQNALDASKAAADQGGALGGAMGTVGKLFGGIL